MEQPESYEFTFDIEGIRLMKGVIDYSIKMWPGSPARPEIEQDFLYYIRDEINRCLMEHSFRHLDVDDK